MYENLTGPAFLLTPLLRLGLDTVRLETILRTIEIATFDSSIKRIAAMPTYLLFCLSSLKVSSSLTFTVLLTLRGTTYLDFIERFKVRATHDALFQWFWRSYISLLLIR